MYPRWVVPPIYPPTKFKILIPSRTRSRSFAEITRLSSAASSALRNSPSINQRIHADHGDESLADMQGRLEHPRPERPGEHRDRLVAQPPGRADQGRDGVGSLPPLASPPGQGLAEGEIAAPSHLQPAADASRAKRPSRS